MRLFKLSLLVAIIGLLSTSDALGAARIQVFEPTGATFTQANGINLLGTVVGWYFDSQTSGHGFVRGASGIITTFDVPGASTGYNQGTFAWAINDAGIVVGTYSTSSLSFHCFLRDAAGNFTTFDVPGETISGYGLGSRATNNAGQIVGVAQGSGTADGFLRQGDGTFSVFNPDGGVIVQYIGINSLGQVAGTYSDTVGTLHGFSRDPSGDITTFDVPGAIQNKSGDGTWAYSLNDSGVIAGGWVDTNLVGHGYLRSPSECA